MPKIIEKEKAHNLVKKGHIFTNDTIGFIKEVDDVVEIKHN